MDTSTIPPAQVTALASVPEPIPATEKSAGKSIPLGKLKSPKLVIKNQKFIQQKSNNVGDEYTVIGRLGSGHYGEVFKVQHKELGLIRALKVIKKDGKKKYSQREEIEVLKSLDHPNILKIYEFYELPNVFYIVTELFEGRDLYTQITENGLLGQGKAAEVSYQTLKALAYTHKRKIVHRDIKLQNILIKEVDGIITIKLIDWGFGSFVKSKLMRVCGTPEYAAPDIFMGQYDEKCDIWSFGVLLYVMLSATFPFKGNNRQETIAMIEKAKFGFQGDIWGGVSPEAKDFISKLIIKNPESRLSAQEALKSDWISKYLKKELNIVVLKDTLSNFKEVCIRNNIATAALNFITNYLSTEEEKEKLNHVFNMLDTNGDGVLSFEEISQGYSIVYGPLVGNTVAEETFSKLDLNHNGVLEYNEFITYSQDLKKMISGDKMKVAFNLFDSNKDGKINLSEMKEIFSYDNHLLEDHKFKNWMEDLDANGDGEIDENEFIKSLIEISTIVQAKSEMEVAEGKTLEAGQPQTKVVGKSETKS